MKKVDVILLVSILLCAFAVFTVFAVNLYGKGDQVVIKIDGEEYARLPLEKDTEILIESEYGTNLLVIKNRKAYIKEASCPDLICVKSGNADELKSIVCLPNKVTVSIVKNEK